VYLSEEDAMDVKEEEEDDDGPVSEAGAHQRGKKKKKLKASYRSSLRPHTVVASEAFAPFQKRVRTSGAKRKKNSRPHTGVA
jgi:hypothetical protein